ncbi:hypothetical protein B0A55_05306 [Friedmanniomyces simplex]|uniref:GPI anchored serine-rich protein n=1 Tax=Friedmanniomyces simplex TaxID=329884 RepID=A0A4U0XBV5_9PEZI|nr:hypothetical protein B0A55_05306 [Friedmanniomyces simplex]
MRSFIAATLFAGVAFALPAPQETETVYDTQIYTITSCGPEVTNCPARQTTSTVVSVTTHPAGPPGYSHGGSLSSSTSVVSPVETSTTPVSVAPVSSASPSVTSAPTPSVYSSAPAVILTSSYSSAPVVISTSVSSAPEVSLASSASAASSAASSPVAPVSTTEVSSAPASPTGYTSVPAAAPYPMPSSSAVGAVGTGSTAAPYYPSGTGAPVASGYASGSATAPKSTGSPMPYTVGAAGLKVAGSLIGAGALAAFFL